MIAAREEQILRCDSVIEQGLVKQFAVLWRYDVIIQCMSQKARGGPIRDLQLVREKRHPFLSWLVAQQTTLRTHVRLRTHRDDRVNENGEIGAGTGSIDPVNRLRFTPIKMGGRRRRQMSAR